MLEKTQSENLGAPFPQQRTNQHQTPSAAHTPAVDKATENDAANTDGADGEETTVDRALSQVKSSTLENARAVVRPRELLGNSAGLLAGSAEAPKAPTMHGEQELDGPAQGGPVENVDNIKPTQGGNAKDDRHNVEHEPALGGGEPHGAICGSCKRCKLLLELACSCGMQRLHAASKRNGAKKELGTELETLVLSFTWSFLSPFVPDPEQEPTQS